MDNELLLLSGNDIPFREGGLSIHQPTIKEIAYIGESQFYTGCQFLFFSKDSLNEKDKIALQNESNFNILMKIIQQGSMEMQRYRVAITMVLSLLFPTYSINFTDMAIVLEDEEKEDKKTINEKNYEKFLDILKESLCLKDILGDTVDNYNPTGDLAKKIAEKLKNRHKKLAELQGGEGSKKVAILSRYISILVVGEKKDMNSFMNYTVYQLFDEFIRYGLKDNYDIHLKAQLAGAKDLKEVDDWRKDIHP